MAKFWTQNWRLNRFKWMLCANQIAPSNGISTFQRIDIRLFTLIKTPKQLYPFHFFFFFSVWTYLITKLIFSSTHVNFICSYYKNFVFSRFTQFIGCHWKVIFLKSVININNTSVWVVTPWIRSQKRNQNTYQITRILHSEKITSIFFPHEENENIENLKHLWNCRK